MGLFISLCDLNQYFPNSSLRQKTQQQTNKNPNHYRPGPGKLFWLWDKITHPSQRQADRCYDLATAACPHSQSSLLLNAAKTPHTQTRSSGSVGWILPAGCHLWIPITGDLAIRSAAFQNFGKVLTLKKRLQICATVNTISIDTLLSCK